jgi:hypothetical protein
VTAGLGDIRPACTELIARALTAHRVGTPAAGTVERTVLSRLLVLLGEQRVRVSKHAAVTNASGHSCGAAPRP